MTYHLLRICESSHGHYHRHNLFDVTHASFTSSNCPEIRRLNVVVFGFEDIRVIIAGLSCLGDELACLGMGLHYIYICIGT